MSIDPAAQLRHELRTPLNHIIGYAEMLLEELEAGDRPDLAAGLGALRADARQLLALLNEVLARGQTGPPDIAAARGTLAPAPRARPLGAARRCAGRRRRPAPPRCSPTSIASARPPNASTSCCATAACRRPGEHAPPAASAEAAPASRRRTAA